MSTKRTISAVGGIMVVGIGAGIAISAAIDNIPVGMSLGLALGLIFGCGIDMNRRRKDRDETEP